MRPELKPGARRQADPPTALTARSNSPEATGARVGRGEESRLKRLEVAFGRPDFFGGYYMRPYDENWDGPMPKLAVDMLRFAMNTRRGVILAAPETMKTTVVSQLYPLWLTYRYAVAGKLGLLYGMLLSEYQDLAERNLSVVSWHIENNARLRADFVDEAGEPIVQPSRIEDKWTDDAIIVRRPGVSKDPTWQARGINAEIQGARLQHLIGDDVVTPKSANSPARQREALRLWDAQVTTRLFEDGTAVIVGNFNHDRDLLSTIGRRGIYEVMRRPTMHVPGRPAEPPVNPRDRDIELAIPERWPRRRLLADLAEKPATFAQIHLLRSGGETGGLLRADWVSLITLEDIPRLSRVYLIGVDPAPGAVVDSDPSFFAYAVGCLTRTHLDVLESHASRLEPTEQVELIGSVFDRYSALGHVGGIAVGKIALDRYFGGAVLVGRPDLRPFMHEQSLIGDKIERLAHLGPYFKSGWARITETAWNAQTDDPDDRAQDETLGEQWQALPNQQHDDRLDAVDVLVREARERTGGPVLGRDVREEGTGRPGSLTGDLMRKVM